MELAEHCEDDLAIVCSLPAKLDIICDRLMIDGCQEVADLGLVRWFDKTLKPGPAPAPVHVPYIYLMQVGHHAVPRYFGSLPYIWTSEHSDTASCRRVFATASLARESAPFRICIRS